MKLKDVLNAATVQELKSVGSFLEIKRGIEHELGTKLGVKSWKELFEKINHLKTVVPKNKVSFLKRNKNKKFNAVKNELTMILALKIKARGWCELNKKVHRIISFFCSSPFNPYEHYEKTKLSNFKHSSKLEGVDIDTSNEHMSLNKTLEKYRIQNNG